MTTRRTVLSTLGAGVGAAAMAIAAAGDVRAQQAPPERPVVRVTAERFSFTPSRITLEVGDEVEIRIRSLDTAHGFRILGTETDIQVPKRGGGEASVIYTAGAAGRFTFECSHLCGAGHNFMRGEIVVRAPGGERR